MGRTSNAREHLIDAGSELMHARGYTAVGVSEVCSKAQVKKGSFYYFFPSKVELALAVIDQHGDEVETAREELAGGSAPPLERLATFLEDIHRQQLALHQGCGHVLGCPLGNLALEMSTQDPQLRARLDEELSKNIRCFETVLRQAIDRGDLPRQSSGTVERTARSILALIQGTLMQAKLADDPDLLADLGEQVERLVAA